MMKDPDGMIIGKRYNIYHICKHTSRISLVEEKVRLIAYEPSASHTTWKFEYTLKRDVQRAGCTGFGLILENLSDQYVIQLEKMERRYQL